MKKLITTVALAAILSISSTFAFAGDGIIVAGFADSGTTTQPCTERTTSKVGIIVAGFTGIIVAGFTGIIVAGFGDTKDAPVDCGIIVAG